MKPNSARLNNLAVMLELREALALIHDFCLEQTAMSDKLLEQLNEQILKIDRRYGDIESWHRSGVGSDKNRMTPE